MKEAVILTGIEVIFFFIGTGGMLILFFQWRRKQDRLAQILCLAAFGTWVLAVATASALGNEGELWEPATVLAAIALGLGFIGACMVSLRSFVRKDERRELSPSSNTEQCQSR